MGFSISWIAVRGKGKEKVLTETGLIDTEEPDETNEAPMSGADLPGGWYLLFMNDLAHPLTTPERLSDLSQDSEVIGCQVEEHVMMSVAFFYQNGRLIWNAVHDSDNGTYHLAIEGSPPIVFAEIRDRLIGKQNAAGGETAGVDFVFDIPVELASAACGYRHDRWKFEWGRPTFTRLEPKSLKPAAR